MTGIQILQRFDSPNAVIAAVVLSTCVAATSAVLVLSQALHDRADTSDTSDIAAVTTPTQPENRPAARVRPLLIPADPASVALGFDDPALRLEPPVALGAVAIDRPAQVAAPLRVIAGPPPVTPPQRPEFDTGLVQVASGLAPARALGLPGPVRRPDTIGAAPAPALAPVAVAGLRPEQRPVTLSTRNEPEADLTLAALTPDSPAATPLRQPALAAPRAGSNPCSNRLTRDMPRRPGSAAAGSAVMASLSGAGGGSRDAAIIEQALRGNIPSHLRNLQPVSFAGLVGGQQTQITLCVTPDYLAIGSDSDHVRVPLGLPAALRIADAYDMMLPTTRMVDAIYAQADLRLSPRPMTPGAQMSSTGYFVQHDETLDAQMASAGGRNGLLVAGHKKDLVLANRLARAPGRVAIYGWHRSGGNPIQPLSTVHGESYADYSHGIRLVSRTAYVDGRAVDLRALLTDGQYAGLLNSDGPLSNSTIRLASLQ